jgi:anti-sigma B factor antagonist
VIDDPEADTDAGGLRMVASRPRPDVLVVAIHGEVDELTAPEWTAYLRHHDADSSPHLVLDLAGITFIGSTGLALLLTELEAVKATHRLFLTGVGDNRRVGRVLELVGVLDRFRTYRDVPAVLDELEP